MGDFEPLYVLTSDASTPLSLMKASVRSPMRSLPTSLTKAAGTPARPKDIMPLNTEPPGTALTGCPPLNIMEDYVEYGLTDTYHLAHCLSFLIMLLIRRKDSEKMLFI